MKALELTLNNAEFVPPEAERAGDLTASPELIAEIDAIFKQKVDVLDQAPIDPEKEHRMGSIYKPVIAGDWQKGARK